MKFLQNLLYETFCKETILVRKLCYETLFLQNFLYETLILQNFLRFLRCIQVKIRFKFGKKSFFLRVLDIITKNKELRERIEQLERTFEGLKQQE